MKPLFKALALLQLLATMPLDAAEVNGHILPDNISRFDTSFTLSGCGFRELLFSDIYLLGMYLADGGREAGAIRDRQVGKVFILDVLYEGNLPEDLPDLWREPLSEQISTELLEILQDLYDRVDTGSRVEFAYHPDAGEVLRINGEVAVRESGRELMPALVELWLGEDPVSGNLKRLLLKGDCG